MQQKTNTMHISAYIQACIQLCTSFPLDINTYFHSRRLKINSPQWVVATEQHGRKAKFTSDSILIAKRRPQKETIKAWRRQQNRIHGNRILPTAVLYCGSNAASFSSKRYIKGRSRITLLHGTYQCQGYNSFLTPWQPFHWLCFPLPCK